MYQPQRHPSIPHTRQIGSVGQQGSHGGRGNRGSRMLGTQATPLTPAREGFQPFGETVNVNPVTGNSNQGNVSSQSPYGRPGNPAAPATTPFAPPAAPAPTAIPPWVHAPGVRPEISAPGEVGFSGPLSVGYRGARVAVPGGIGYDGPMAHSYMPNRITPHGMVDAQADVGRIAAGQRGMFHVEPNERMRSSGLPTLERFAADANRLEGTTFRRGLNLLEPQMDDDRARVEQRLADQGIPIGSEAYEAEMSRLDRQQALARENLALSSVGAGRQEHSRITDLARVLQGQRFGQDAQGNQMDFGQRHSSARLGADESGRRFSELLAGQRQQHGLNQVNREFTARERSRDFQENLASEAQYAAQRAQADRFAADQARYAHGSDVQQRQQAYVNALAGEDQYFRQGLAADQFGAQQAAARDQFGLGQRQWNAQFGSHEAQRRYNQAMGNAQFYAGQHMDRAAFDAAQRQAGFNNALAGASFRAGEDQRGIMNQFTHRGLLNQRYLADRQHNANVQGSRWSGIAGIAGSVLPWILSDETAKVDHGVIGALPLHAFTYKGDPAGKVYSGVMAGEVAEAMPEAVADGPDGFRRVDLAAMIAGGA